MIKKSEEEEQEREVETLKGLAPAQASSLREEWESIKALRKSILDRESGPCHPLNSLAPAIGP
jgi:hypothetical protein